MVANINDNINHFVRKYVLNYNLETHTTTEVEPPSRAYVPALTGIRGLAALIVAYSHYSGSGGTLGQIGVQIFFVLSAYLMCVLYLEGSETKPGEFIRNRLIRVLPLLSLVTLISKVCSHHPAIKLYDMFAAKEPLWKYLVLKSGASIEWTIAMEVSFYLWFALLLCFPKMMRHIILFVFTAGSIAEFVFEPRRNFTDISGISWGIITEKAYVYKWFALGIFAWYIERTAAKNKWFYPQNMREIYNKIVLECILLSVFVGCFIIRCIYWQIMRDLLYNDWDSIVDAVAMVTLLLGGKHLWPLSSLFSSPLMEHIGKVSYSLYLTHLWVFTFMNRSGLRNHRNPLLVLTFFAACTLVSSITFYLIEQPVNTTLRKALKNNPKNREILPFRPESATSNK